MEDKTDFIAVTILLLASQVIGALIGSLLVLERVF